MSKIINFAKPLNAADEQYVNERPWLVAEATAAGHTVRYKSGAPGADPNEGSQEAEEDETDEESTSYEDATVAELKAEIESRNEERDEDDHIVPDGSKKADLIAALEADDEANSDEE